MHQERNPFIDGKLYGDTAAWITVIGMSIALLGIVFSAFLGGGVFYSKRLMANLLSGKEVHIIWESSSVFGKSPPKYWFFKEHLCPDVISMIGIAIACYGSIFGLLAMLISMFKRKEVLFYKKGLYTVLTMLITGIVVLAALGVIALKR